MGPIKNLMRKMMGRPQGFHRIGNGNNDDETDAVDEHQNMCVIHGGPRKDCAKCKDPNQHCPQCGGLIPSIGEAVKLCPNSQCKNVTDTKRLRCLRCHGPDLVVAFKCRRCGFVWRKKGAEVWTSSHTLLMALISLGI
ncbi:hypothetical protein BDV95DRAFT_612035 [Massariosphaeria phaeospora]|uniref:Uncharacterized protein n=1 Tax=Massariosphaeria phaeospora TaxID=100035 RepID=A0A7C8HZE8_9PLEO|nr:hypothetical protein BDV95DRAFT_612035 [Massariosphaeria phaeospora]